MIRDKWAVPGMATDRHESGLCRKTIALMDVSLRASRNNRGQKLGFGNCTFATAVLGYDTVTKQLDSGDGTTTNLIRFPFEPDNWAFREHGGGDKVWAVRLCVDKTNKAQDKKNRSTHVLDQQEEQRYGNFADLFWICKTEVDTDFGMNGAGYNQRGDGDRDALALSTAKNEGFISDGKKFGQLGNVFTFEDEDAEATPGGGGDTPTTGGGGGGTPTVGGPNTRPDLTPSGNGGFVRPQSGHDAQQGPQQFVNPSTGHETQQAGNPGDPKPTVVSTYQNPDGTWHQVMSDGTVN